MADEATTTTTTITTARTTSAYRDGNRARRPVVGSRSSCLRHCPFLLPLLLLVLRDIIDESTSSATTLFGHDASAFNAVPLIRSCHSLLLHRPFSTADCCGPKSKWNNHNNNNNNNNNDNNDNHHRLLQKDGNAILRASSSSSSSGEKDQSNRIRLNKVFKRTHSRREADRLIEDGRVSVNGERVMTRGGFFVFPYVDEVSLDGTVIEGWEEMNYVVANDNRNNNNDSSSKTNEPVQPEPSKRTNTNDGSSSSSGDHNDDERRTTFEYIKYWKPRGVICTTDPNIPFNIIDEIREHDGYDAPHRVYPIGRLDKETTGLILLTSDGRLPNAALRKEHKRPKIYEALLDPPIGPPGCERSKYVLEALSNGVVISTETVRNGVRKTLTAPTEPCTVEQLNDRWIRITLKEGRNRQVRKMTKAVGHQTVELERVSFAGIPLEPGLRGPGDWDYLTGAELEIVQTMIRIAAEAQEAEGAQW